MLKIHELLDRDPRVSALANKGQARIGDAADPALDGEDRAELEFFVCDGRFSDGLQRILERFLADLGGKRQEAAWVSGFFGSGKSHLLKMLAHLWANRAFGDGATARSLVPGGLPPEIRAALTELDTRARRIGKPPLAAAGTLLGGNERVRSAVLSILLRARGLPSGIPQARFTFWLQDEGILDQVRDAVEHGEDPRDWRKELNNFLVSRRISEALLAASPTFAAGPKDVRKQLAAQFPPPTGDLTTEEFVDLARKALAEDAALPLTVLVLDEAQQYIGDSGERSAVFSEVAEAIQTEFDTRVALVASGQSALSQTPALQKLRDRFRIKIELTDADVEVVTRKVLLAKKPSAGTAIREVFDAHEGEVSRHLRETALGPRASDREDGVKDYPLLGTRRRFWEASLRAVDAAGVRSQLRSQLAILHNALSRLADRNLGAVIPASELFHEVSSDLVSSGVLLNEIHTRIQQLDDASAEGRRRRDVAALVFLIGRLPREAAVDTGVRADATTLADLLVEDLTEDSGPFRQQVADALEALADERVLMKIGAEYRIQTTEGAEWDAELQRQSASLRSDEAAVGAERDRLFGTAVEAAVSAVRPRQGASRERRTLRIHRAGEPPAPDGRSVTVWLRDGWQVSAREFDRQARGAGITDPTLYIHIAKRESDALRQRIVAALAAQRVLDQRGVPHSEAGREARASMESRLAEACEGRDGIVRGLLREARVLRGGAEEVFGDDLAAKITHGAAASFARLFPRFPEGDHAQWAVALRRAAERSERPFAPLGWDRDPAEHQVATEVMNAVGAGARGTEVHRTLGAAPFGWPQDAVDAALIALHAAGRLRATRNGEPVPPGRLNQAGVKAAIFRPEQVVLTVEQKLALRGLLRRAGVAVVRDEEQQGVAQFLGGLRELGYRAGGEPPLPTSPASPLLDDLIRKTGNEQLLAVHDHRDELERLLAEWTALTERAAPRRLQWELATALRRHAAGLPVHDEIAPELDVILIERSLLDETDRVAPQAAKVAAALRKEVTALRKTLDVVVGEAEEELAADPNWARLDPAQREAILRQHSLTRPPPLDVSTDEALRQTLNDRPLSSWRAEADAVATRLARVQAAAAELAAPGAPETRRPKPTTVTLRRATLDDEQAVRNWLSESETALVEAVRHGPVTITLASERKHP